MDPIIAATYDVVGQHDANDWKLDPGQHIKNLTKNTVPEPAAKLIEILQQPRVDELRTQFEAADLIAGRAQARYRRLRAFMIWTAVGAAAFGALFAAFPPSSWTFLSNLSEAREQWILSGLLLVLAGAALVVASNWARRNKPLVKPWFNMAMTTALIAVLAIAFLRLDPSETRGQITPKCEFILILAVCLLFLASTLAGIVWQPATAYAMWMGQRAKAEQLRKEYFEEIMRSGDDRAQPSQGELPLLPLKLEFFRRYQMDVQTAYYEGRGYEHGVLAKQASRANKATDWLPLLGICALIAAAFAPAAEQGAISTLFQEASSLLQVAPEVDIAKLLLVVLISTAAISSGWIAQTQVMNNGRNAERYSNTLKNLLAQKQFGLDAARAAALAGDTEGARRFVWAIHQVMGAELQEWTVLNEPLDLLRKERGVG